MTSLWKAFLGIVLVFVFGCISGSVSTSIFYQRKATYFLQHPAIAASAALEKRLTGNLGLDADQKKQIHAIFVDNLEHRKELQKQIQPQVQSLNRQTFQQIAAVLHPGQSELFRQNLEKMHKRLGRNAVNATTDISPPVQPQSSIPIPAKIDTETAPPP